MENNLIKVLQISDTSRICINYDVYRRDEIYQLELQELVTYRADSGSELKVWEFLEEVNDFCYDLNGITLELAKEHFGL